MAHLWFSRQQLDWMKYLSSEKVLIFGETYKPAFGRLSNGQVVQYTEMTGLRDGVKRDPMGNFDDFIYLGEGKFIGNSLEIEDEVQRWLDEQFAEDSAWDWR